MKKILITGAGGYIGSVSTYYFLQKGFDIVAVDSFARGFQQPLVLLQKKYGKKNLRFYTIDLKDNFEHLLKREKNIDTVIHYAAFCHIDESMVNPSLYFENNSIGSYNLLKFMMNNQIKKIVFSSTCAVYTPTTSMPITEDSLLKPISPYGESKLLTENMLKWYAFTKDINYIIFRYFNVTGASDDGVLGDSKKPSLALVQNAVRSAIHAEPFYATYSKSQTPDKSPIRDYINVVDLSEAHYKAFNYLQKNKKNHVINLGTGKGSSVKEVIDTVKNITKQSFLVKKTSSRKGEHPIMIASIIHAKNILNWKPKRTLTNSIESLMKWYKKNPDGWEY